MKMNPGKFRHRITIQKYTDVEGEWGQTTTEWADWSTRWASINSLYGREFWQAKEANMENTINITIRYSKDLKDLDSREYRIKWDKKIYNIIFIENLQFSNKYLIFKCVEVIE